MIERRIAREAVLQALYAHDVGWNSLEDIRKNVINPKLEDKKDLRIFAEKLLIRTLENRDELDSVVEDQVKNWKMSRLAILDKLILRMAVCEYIYFEEIPTKVSLNESIELAKKFSTGKSGTFVNGILDGALKKLDREGRIQKKGKGLIEKSYKE